MGGGVCFFFFLFCFFNASSIPRSPAPGGTFLLLLLLLPWEPPRFPRYENGASQQSPCLKKFVKSSFTWHSCQGGFVSGRLKRGEREVLPSSPLLRAQA